MEKIKTIKDWHTSREKLVEFWEQSGLLIGVDDNIKAELARALEDMASYLITLGVEYRDVESIMLTIMRKLLIEYGYIIKNCKAAVDYVFSQKDRLLKLISDVHSAIFGEVDFAIDMTQEIYRLKL